MRILKSFNSIIFITASLVYSVSTNAQPAAPTCNALINIKNDLWLATKNGELQTQLTHDGKLKFAIAVSPNGKVIAYDDEQSINKVILIDTKGTHLADLNVKVEDAITALAWTSPDTLKIRQHISPSVSKYFFMRVPTNPFSNHFSEIFPPTPGNDCTTSPNGEYVACFFGGTLSLNGRSIYTLTNPFIAAEKLQSLNLAVGSTALTSTIPAFEIQIMDIKDGKIHVKTSSAAGEWQEYHQNKGDTVELTYFNDSKDVDEPLPLFGLQLNFDNSNAKAATLTLLKSLHGNVSFEASPVWDIRGKRIAFIEKNDAGKRELVLINRELSNSGAAKDSIEGRITLPAQTPVTNLNFTSDTHLVIKSENGKLLDIDIPAQGKILSTTSFQVGSSLPDRISTKDRSISVVDWICSQEL